MSERAEMECIKNDFRFLIRENGIEKLEVHGNFAILKSSLRPPPPWRVFFQPTAPLFLSSKLIMRYTFALSRKFQVSQDWRAWQVRPIQSSPFSLSLNRTVRSPCRRRTLRRSRPWRGLSPPRRERRLRPERRRWWRRRPARPKRRIFPGWRSFPLSAPLP